MCLCGSAVDPNTHVCTQIHMMSDRGIRVDPVVKLDFGRSILVLREVYACMSMCTRELSLIHI